MSNYFLNGIFNYIRCLSADITFSILLGAHIKGTHLMCCHFVIELMLLVKYALDRTSPFGKKRLEYPIALRPLRAYHANFNIKHAKFI